MTNKNIFIYIAIIICAYLYFKRYNIKLNIILGIAVAIFIIYILEKNYNKTNLETQNTLSNKKILLRPKNKLVENKPEIINFLFSIQKIYMYNPKSFEELVNNLNDFFDCHNETKINNCVASERFNDMMTIRRNALNSLHSIILSIPPAHNNSYIDKISNSLDKLDSLLNYYITDAYMTAKKYTKEKGLDYTQNVLKDSPYVEKNTYDTGYGKYSSIYSYQYF